MGVDTDYFYIRNMNTEKGELFYDSDVENGTKSVCNRENCSDNLFGDIDRWTDIRIRIILYSEGVMESKGHKMCWVEIRMIVFGHLIQLSMLDYWVVDGEL
jgi:hypothetical protein